MKKIISFILFLLLGSNTHIFGQAELSENKLAIISSVHNHEEKLIEISDQIWEFAEIAFHEYKSSKILADYAEQQGFTVERGVAEMPTAFIASYGSGKPVIGILGEYDALPGLSQKAVSYKEALEEGKPGHGCGHNLFGAASLGAAIAVKELIEKGELKGTVKFFGTPAEEQYGGKIYMARAGLFNNLDVCLDWHPMFETKASTQSSLALIDFRIRYKGKTAHAASDPWNGISAADALELYTTGINYLREHIKPTVRIHYLMENAGDVVNVVPENASIWTRIRDRDSDGMNLVYEKALKIAEGAALMTGAEYSVELISGYHEILVNRTGAAILQKNLESLGSIKYSDDEIEFAKNIQKETGKETSGLNAKINPLEETRENPRGGSTDVGDVSWNVPVIRLTATTAPFLVPWHSWAVTACGGMSIGHKGLVYTSKALGLTMVDLFENEDLISSVKKEFNERKGNHVYTPILPDGPPPIPKNNISLSN